MLNEKKGWKLECEERFDVFSNSIRVTILLMEKALLSKWYKMIFKDLFRNDQWNFCKHIIATRPTKHLSGLCE